MIFNSLSYALFLPIVFVLYWILPYRFRRPFLLIASCYFYMAFVPSYVLILFFLISLDYFLAFLIHRAVNTKKRKTYLVLSIIANLGTLFFFKYLNFFNENLASFIHLLHFNYSPFLLQIALPLGLSFHIFQSLSYVVEVYRGKYIPEKNYITYALYVMFFPQLVAGPIERPQHLLPQLNIDHVFDHTKARRGIERILWGLFKKLVIADQFSRIIETLYVNLPSDGLSLILIMVMFTYQLYCDFSGYSDIAVGSAMLFGFDLTENFRRPFAATSVGEFWRRWHISLSSWLRDYLYYPLAFGFGKVTKMKLYLSSFITFTLIGLWHGANWTYVVFGMMQGIYLVIGSATESARKALQTTLHLLRFPRAHRALQAIVVFALFALSLVFFRSENMHQALWIMKNIFSIPDFGFFISQIRSNPTYIGTHVIFVPAAIATIAMEIIQYYQAKQGTLYIFENKPRKIRYLWYYTLVIAIMMFGYFGGQSFIYFKF